MTCILVVESNTPEDVTQMISHGYSSAAQIYASALQSIQTDVEVRIISPYAGKVSENQFENVDGAAFTGSSANWSTDAPEAEPLRTVMERLFKYDVPVIGSCNGMQLGAVVLGGKVRFSPNGMETGLAKQVKLTGSGKIHAMMSGRQDSYSVTSIHGDEVAELPEGGVLLSGNAHSQCQAMAYETNGVRFWGMQYHPELSVDDLANMLVIQTGKSESDGFIRQLRLAENDEGPARQLGGTCRELKADVRMTELKNWLNYISEDSE